MHVEHLNSDAKPEQISKVLERDACVVIDRVAAPDQLARVRDEMAPFIEANDAGLRGGRNASKTSRGGGDPGRDRGAVTAARASGPGWIPPSTDTAARGT